MKTVKCAAVNASILARGQTLLQALLEPRTCSRHVELLANFDIHGTLLVAILFFSHAGIRKRWIFSLAWFILLDNFHNPHDSRDFVVAEVEESKALLIAYMSAMMGSPTPNHGRIARPTTSASSDTDSWRVNSERLCDLDAQACHTATHCSILPYFSTKQSFRSSSSLPRPCRLSVSLAVT